MVYTDLVQSTVVGNGKFPLLRKLSVVRQGQGRVTVEPYHREWVPEKPIGSKGWKFSCRRPVVT